MKQGWKGQCVDQAFECFHRGSGQNVLVYNQSTKKLKRKAPRSAQISLTSHCNMDCSFCYRDQEAENTFTPEYMTDLLIKLSEWGVLEVSFGGGEPLLYEGFVELIREVYQTTDMGLNLTTNGLLLTDEKISKLSPYIGEFRLSIYPDNDYEQTLRRLKGLNVGVNQLLSNENIPILEAHINHLLSEGVDNILLLDYKGEDSLYQLTDQSMETLKDVLGKLKGYPIRMDSCLYPHLTDLPHLFSRCDCGAGDEFFSISPDRKVKPCSFHHEEYAFESIEELQEIYCQMKDQKPVAKVSGCYRDLFVRPEDHDVISSSHILSVQEDRDNIWMWNSRASNNSGDYTIIGQFETVVVAKEVCEALRELAEKHRKFISTDEGEEWFDELDLYGIPTPPLRDFGKKYGFDWTDDDDALWWEEDGVGDDVLTVGTIDKNVVVYHPYAMGLPENALKKYFKIKGSLFFRFMAYESPNISVKAKGNNEEAIKVLEKLLSELDDEDVDPEDVEHPWANEELKPEVLDLQDDGIVLVEGKHEMNCKDGILNMTLQFGNTFAGCVAIRKWLKKEGFEEIEIEIL